MCADTCAHRLVYPCICACVHARTAARGFWYVCKCVCGRGVLPFVCLTVGSAALLVHKRSPYISTQHHGNTPTVAAMMHYDLMVIVYSDFISWICVLASLSTCACMQVCVCVCVGPPHPLVPPGDVPVVLQKGA
jgi:hypothetical protein